MKLPAAAWLAMLMLIVPLPASAKIHRSHAAIAAFKRDHPCPANAARRGPCPGYVIDHIEPLCAGGADQPANMQWQTKAASLVKDRAEWAECRLIRRNNSAAIDKHY